jgi:transcription elongation factor Elf1
MKSQTKAYGMPRLSPWSAEDVEYDGCCNHSALLEGISGEEKGLTLEQIVAKKAEMDQKRLVQQPTQRAGYIASQKYFCKICNKAYLSTTALEIHETSQMHIDNAAGVTKVLTEAGARDKALTEKNKAEKRFHCKVCNLSCANSGKLEKHKKTEGHIEKAAKAKPQGYVEEVYVISPLSTRPFARARKSVAPIHPFLDSVQS